MKVTLNNFIKKIETELEKSKQNQLLEKEILTGECKKLCVKLPNYGNKDIRD